MGVGKMSDFMQRQFDISQELIRLMNREHEQRSRFFEKYEEQIKEKDRYIAKLEATIQALEVLVKK
jgi:hypothetical protein